MCDQVSARVSIAFNDVAAYFSEEEWSRLEDWEKELYRSVMKEIHGALISLGYAIVNPDILLRIKQAEEPCGKDPHSRHFQHPQQSPQNQKSPQSQRSPQQPEQSEHISDELEFVKALTPGSPVFNPEVSLWIKEVEESGPMSQLPQTAQPPQSPLIPQQPQPETQSQEISTPLPAVADHPFVKPDILLRIQQIEPLEETIVPEHWVFEAPANSPTPCFPVYQSVFQGNVKNEGQPCDSEEREGMKHSEIDYGSINIVTVTEDQAYTESASQHEASPDEVEEIIPVCFDDEDDDDDFHLPQMTLRDKRYPPRYLMDGSFECEYQPDDGSLTLDPVTYAEEYADSSSRASFKAIDKKPCYFHGKNLCQRLQRPVRQKHCAPRDHVDGDFGFSDDTDEFISPILRQKVFPSGKIYSCEICCEVFNEKEAAMKHQKDHAISDYNSAKRVDFFLKSSYIKGPQRRQSGAAVHWCDVCERSFSDSYKLRVHQRNHTGEKCMVCGKGFTMKAYLKFHIRTHTGERPFLCKFCGKGFTKSYHMKVHLRIHTGEKPYKCLECGKRFTVNSHLKSHGNTHKRTVARYFH